MSLNLQCPGTLLPCSILHGFGRPAGNLVECNTITMILPVGRSDAMIHLTNVVGFLVRMRHVKRISTNFYCEAVQKHNDHYDEKRGGKWDLKLGTNSAAAVTRS